MRVVIDRDRCIGSAQCVLSAPEAFDQDESDGRVLLRADPDRPEALDRVRVAVRFCPSRALSLAE